MKYFITYWAKNPAYSNDRGEFYNVIVEKIHPTIWLETIRKEQESHPWDERKELSD